MKFANPYFKSNAQKKVEQNQSAVSAWMAANAGNRVVSIAELRAGLPAIAADLGIDVVQQICQNIGALRVDPEDNTE